MENDVRSLKEVAASHSLDRTAGARLVCLVLSLLGLTLVALLNEGEAELQIVELLACFCSTSGGPQRNARDIVVINLKVALDSFQ